MKIKCRFVKIEYREIEVTKSKLAKFGEIILPFDGKEVEYNPMLVTNTFWYDDRLKLKGRGYVWCIDENGIIRRMEDYEYVILENAEKEREEYKKRFSREEINERLRQFQIRE